jgi:hypothetical protein
MRHVRSLADLKALAATDDRYARVAIYTAGDSYTPDLSLADALASLDAEVRAGDPDDVVGRANMQISYAMGYKPHRPRGW